MVKVDSVAKVSQERAASTIRFYMVSLTVRSGTVNESVGQPTGGGNLHHNTRQEYFMSVRLLKGDFRLTVS